MASEVGKAWGRRPVLFPTFRRVPAGTPGGISLVGTAAGLVGAAVLGVTRGGNWRRALGCAAPGHGRRDDWRVRGERHGRDPRRAWSPQQRSAQFPEHRHRRGGRDLHCEVARIMRPRLLFELARPFTLIAPAIGFASAAVTAAGAAPPPHGPGPCCSIRRSASAMAALLNAASNALNQIYDLEIDRVNKPGRPLTSGRLSMRDAWFFTVRHTVRHSCSPGSWRRRAATSVSGSSSRLPASPSPIRSRR